MKYVIRNYYLLMYALFFSGFNCFAMEPVIDTAKKYIKTTKNALEKVEQMLNEVSIENGVDLSNIVRDEDLAPVIEFFNDNPEVLEMLKESAFGTPSLKTKFAQYITAFPEHLLQQVRGYLGGFTSACLLMLAYNAAYPGTLCEVAPQGAFAGAFIGVFSMLAIKAYTMLSIPDSLDKIALNRLFSLATRLAPMMVTVGHIKATTQVTPEIQSSFTNFIESLTYEQKAKLSAPYVLLQAQINPQVLIKEIPFLDDLTSDQVDSLYTYLYKTIPDIITQDFELFAQELDSETCKALNPENKLLLASFNPLLLCTKRNTNFLKKLNTRQCQLLEELTK